MTLQPARRGTAAGRDGQCESRSPRAVTRLPWAIAALAVGLNAVAVWLIALNREVTIGGSYGPRGFQIVFSMIFALVGAVVAAHRPRNPIGWIFCWVGFIAALQGAAVEYGIYTLYTSPGALPFGMAVVWFQYWIWIVMIFPLLVYVPLLFPNGQLLSPRWRPVAWLVAALILLGSVSFAFAPGPIGEEFPELPNPYGLEGYRAPLIAIFSASAVILLSIALAAAGSLLLRLRRATGEERQQLKWFAYALVFAAVVSPLSPNPTWGALITITSWLSVPIAAGIAILRYRLYDIDLLINRTLVYGSLTVALALVYLGGTVSLQTIFRTLTGQGSQLAIVASTLAIAALFNPLRRRLQDFIDRRFYRRKYDAEHVLATFSATVREEVDLDRLTGALLGVIEETMHPAHVSLWLREVPPDHIGQSSQSAVVSRQ